MKWSGENLDKAVVTKISDCSQKALFYELSLSPKPGLVDRFNNGSHQDMNFFTFIDSIIALTPSFTAYLLAGYQHAGPLPALFAQLRCLGQVAEKEMLTATKGINTHKGANFSFALYLGAVGFYLQDHALPFTPQDTTAIFRLVQEMTADLVAQDFKDVAQKTNLSYGEKIYVQYQFTGVRGEAASGYPLLTKNLLPYLRQLRSLPQEERFLRGLVLAMSLLEDGNLLHRGGFDAWQEVQAEAKKVVGQDLGTAAFFAWLKAYDATLQARNLSPGGSADLLSLGILCLALEEAI